MRPRSESKRPNLRLLVERYQRQGNDIFSCYLLLVRCVRRDGREGASCCGLQLSEGR